MLYFSCCSTGYGYDKQNIQERSDKHVIIPERSDVVLLPHHFTNLVIRLGMLNIHSLNIIYC